MLGRVLPFLLAGFCLLAAAAALRAQSDERVAACEALLGEQWRHLAHGKTAAADQALDRARRLGCLTPPLAGRLCHIPADQARHYEETGNGFLANSARHQQRYLGCLAAD